MPTCKNGAGSYTGTEPSPKGRGYCARHEKIGTKKRGRDKKMWVVKTVKLLSGKRSRRWFKVVKSAKKRKRPLTKKRTSTQPKKRLKGGVKSEKEKKLKKPKKRKKSTSAKTKRLKKLKRSKRIEYYKQFKAHKDSKEKKPGDEGYDSQIDVSTEEPTDSELEYSTEVESDME